MDAGSAPEERRLRRELGVFGAVMLGLGSIVGTGVFVSLGVAAGVAGPAVLLAMTGLAQIMSIERSFGLVTGHAEADAYVRDLLGRLEDAGHLAPSERRASE